MTYVVGVTGSRTWDDPDTILQIMKTVQGDRPSHDMYLHHGKCPPRRPNGDPISWSAGRVMPYEDQLRLKGADWLCDVHARNLGWRIRVWPADWRSEPKRAGFVRNQQMVLGAHADFWLAFIMDCSDWRCRRREPHGSHGSEDCLNRVRHAGIKREVFRRGW